ncbi:hypothetical protein [Selenihalanaerobacter shriftii]|uniref:Uncharacterized protein n=1 Tax=Selenihalanaerobacter shriftii TaxID=142842 RepID=A0A1T4PPI7_9FIRM|nr:hypothetical protein [Selenihalanaerobacter shriftii]SJZ93339.1 hypothetical protein SAMN02745118_02263 [Selenihalanaerobacter shriftii]
MSRKNQFNFSIFDSLYNQPLSELQENNFHLLKFEQLLKKKPKETLNYLFFSYYYPQRNELKIEKIENILRLIIDKTYLQIISYMNYLEEPYKTALENFDQYQDLCNFVKRIRSKLRRLIEELLWDEDLPRAVKGVIKNGIYKIAKFDAYAKRKLETAESEFDSEEIVENITTYLKDSEVLADLAYFKELYFSPNQLTPIKSQLQLRSFNEFAYKFLKEELLTPSIKEKIIDQLNKFINEYPLRDQAKQAYAIYLTLGKAIPWEKHPFIRRIVVNSHLEAKVNKLKTCNTQNHSTGD